MRGDQPGFQGGTLVTVEVPPRGTVLFIGDSITDCGRDRTDPDSLGVGYPALAAAGFAAAHAEAGVRFANRGISGDRAVDLRARWQRDCLDLKPDVVSIMIGINDVWRRYDHDDPTSAAAFAQDYRHILTQSADQGARLIIMEPFLLPVSEDQARWREDLDPKLAVVRRLAAEFAAALIPADAVLTRAAASATAVCLAQDGVHPTAAGHAILAEAWLETVGVAATQ
jgi:lysophospholipase L1-like esterase